MKATLLAEEIAHIDAAYRPKATVGLRLRWREGIVPCGIKRQGVINRKEALMKPYSRLAVGFMVLSIVAGAAGVALAQTHTFRFGHNNAVTHPVNLGAEQFAKRVKERTNGQVMIQVYPAAQLGDERQLGEALQVGTVDMMWSSGPMLGRYVAPFNGLEGGYLFRDQEHLYKVVRGPIGQELNEQLIKGIGVRVLDYHFAGERHLTTTNKAVRTPADLKGMLIRVPQLDNYMATFKALGASTVVVRLRVWGCRDRASEAISLMCSGAGPMKVMI